MKRYVKHATDDGEFYTGEANYREVSSWQKLGKVLEEFDEL